jgi:acyl-CoA thioesterase FadM
MDFFYEARLFDRVLVCMSLNNLSRSRLECTFEFVREADNTLLAKGKQAVVWTNPQHRPGLMPDKLFDGIATYFGVHEL